MTPLTLGQRIYLGAVAALALVVGYWCYFVPTRSAVAIPWQLPSLCATFLGQHPERQVHRVGQGRRRHGERRQGEARGAPLRRGHRSRHDREDVFGIVRQVGRSAVVQRN